MDKLPTSSKRLKISHPAAPNARLLLIVCGALVLSSLALLFVFSGPQTEPIARVFEAVLVLVGLAGVFLALRHMVSVTVPEQFSRLASDGSIIYALQHRSIYGKDDLIIRRSSWRMFLLWLIPDERLIAMSPRIRELLLKSARAGSRWVIALVVLIFAAMFAQVEFRWSILIAIAAMYTLFYLAVISSFRSGGEASTSVHIASEVIPSAGHPQMLYAILENKARSLDTEGYAVWLNSLKPELKVDGVTDTGTFQSHIFLEEQPFPVEASGRNAFSRIAFPVGAGGVLVGIWGFLYFMSQPAQDSTTGYILLLVAWIWLALKAARIAWKLECAFRFKSNVCLMDLDGTFSQSHIRIGKG